MTSAHGLVLLHSYSFPTAARLLASGETEPGATGALVKDGKDSLEEDVTEDGKTDASVALNTTETLAVADGCVVNVRAWDDKGAGADLDGEVGKGSRAGNNVTTLVVVKGSARHLAVVGSDDRRWEVQKSGTGVSDGGANAGADGGTGADLVATGGEAPETLAVVDRDVGDSARVLGAVNETEVVGTCSTLSEADGEERSGKGRLDRVKEGGLLLGADRVDAAEGQAEKTVVVGVSNELSRDGGGSLNGLRSGSHAANDDLVSIDAASSTRAIAVADLPGVAGLEGTAGGRVVDRVARSLA